MKYTKEQLLVINHNIQSHALVSAVAGSGKTQTLIGRIKFLIDSGINPNKILVLMFNKSIQIEFRQRLIDVIGFDIASKVNVKTTHSLGNSFLNAFKKSGLINFNKISNNDFEIRDIIEKSIKKAQLELKLTKKIDQDIVAEFKDYISLLKSTMTLRHKKIEALSVKDKRLLYKTFEISESEIKKNGILTFDDMLYASCKLFENNQAARKQAENIYSHIIIDEYQDINETQQYLIKCLAGDDNTVMAVGDVDQSIYGWRGSTPYYMLEGFMKDFKNAKHFKLSYTFRYGDLISLMANNIITNNKKRHKNICVTHPDMPKSSSVSIEEDSNNVVLQIKQLLSNGVDISEIAVLVRKYNSTTIFELSCLYNDLPYKTEESKNVFDEKLFLAIYGYLMLFNNCKGFDKYEIQDRSKFIDAMLDYPSLYLTKNLKQNIINQISLDIKNSYKYIEELSENVDKKFKETNILNISKSWKDILSNGKNMQVESAVEYILDILDLKNAIQKSKSDYQSYTNQSKLKIIEGISQFAKSKNVSLDGFLDILYDLNMKSNKKNISDEDKVLITSMHKAKGMEWEYVVLYDITEGAFFGEKNDSIKEDVLEEERRLFYVAVTRVKKHLFIVSSTDKNRLSEWFKLKTNKHPKSLKCNNSLRFLYESNLNESQRFISSVNENEEMVHLGMFKKYLEKKSNV